DNTSTPTDMKQRALGKTDEDCDAEYEIEASRPIRKKIETWANQNCSRLKAWPKPERLLGVSDRQRDICNPLLKIADLVGGGWLPKLADALTKVLRAREHDESRGIRLLSDIH